MPTLDEAGALFDRRLRAWVAGDVEAYLALWAPDMTVGSPVHPEIRGRDAYAALIRTSMANVEPLAFTLRHLAVNGDVVLAEWTMRARHRADGRLLEWTGMSACAIEGGLIAWWREYWNPAAFA